jgi:hypothetical protein
MAETDAAGTAHPSGPQPPARKGSLSTLAEIQRDIDRATAPLRAAQREAERSMAPMLAAAREFERYRRRIAAEIDKAIGPYLRTFAGTTAQKEATPRPQDSDRRLPPPAPTAAAHAAPAPDANPAAVSALVETVSAEVWERLAVSLTGETAALKEEIRTTIAEEVRKAFAEAAASKKDRKPRGETTCERFRDLHVNVDPEFAETAPERLLGERIERKPGTFPSSHYWRTVLRPKRAEVRAEIREAKRKLRTAQKWGDFNSAGRRDENLEDH